MNVFNRHLMVLLGLVALTAFAIGLPRSEDDSRAEAAPVRRLPPVVDGWTIADTTAPEDVLPSDPRAREVARWTYSKGDRDVFVAIARYRSSGDPEWRPSINQIAPARGASSVRQDRLAINWNGVAAPMNTVTVKNPGRNVSVVYWYQIREQTIADEFHLRLIMLLDSLRRRGQEVWLIRIATTTAERPADFLREFYPQFVKTLSR